jgi:hypothetical protein
MKTAAGNLSDTSPSNKTKYSNHTSKEFNFLKEFLWLDRYITEALISQEMLTLRPVPEKGGN